MLEDQTNAELEPPPADIPARAVRPAADDHPMSDMEWNDLLDRIEDHDVVPVLGRALSLVASPDGSPVRLYEDLLVQNVKALGSGSDRPVASIATYEELFAARQVLGEADIDFHKRLARQIARYQILPRPFEDLAAITDFQLYLSTAPDDALSRVLGDDASRGPVDTRTFDGTALIDLPRSFSTAPRTCVYRLLGSVETAPNWGLFGDDLVRTLFALWDVRTKPSELLRYLDDKHILAIGCQVPDWFGRFFMHWMRSGPVRNSKASHHLIDADSDIDVLFRKYICQFGKKAIVVSSHPVQFVAELRRRWTARQGSRPTRPVAGVGDSRSAEIDDLAGKVFISYVGADRPQAESIANYLCDQSVDVFYDRDSIPPGAHWESFLAKALDKCMAFVILISDAGMQRDESVAFLEWREIVNRSNRIRNKNEFVYPILLSDGKLENVPGDIDLAQFQAQRMTALSDLDGLASTLRTRQRDMRRNVH